MMRVIGTVAIGSLLTVSPAFAGGSMEQPSDKKAPQANEFGSDNPVNAGKGAAKPSGDGSPLPEGAAEGTLSGSSGSTSPDSSAVQSGQQPSK